MNQIPVYDSKGKELEKLNIETSFTQGAKISEAYSCIIRALRQNWRQGTVGCKTRADLAFSNRKPWKQKGTGRARAGSLRSPLWRKGAVLFGPQPRVRQLAVNKKQNRTVLNEIFADFVKKNNVYGLDFSLQDEKPSTKSAFNVLQNLNLNTKKVVLFLSFNDELLLASFRNLPNVNILCFDQPNAYDISNAQCWVFLKKDVELFKNMVSSWS